MQMKLTNFFLTMVSAGLCFGVFWFRFIRERLPRDIPFQLNGIQCVLLIILCLILLFSIITLIWNIPVKNELSAYLYKPFIFLDNKIKNNYYIIYLFDRWFIPFFMYVRNHVNTIVYIIIVSKCFIALILFLDSIYWHKLHYFYKVIMLYLIIYSVKYYLYTINIIKNDQITKLNEICSLREFNIAGPVITIKDFIHKQTQQMFTNQPLFDYGIVPHDAFLRRELKELKLKPHQRLDVKAYLKNIKKIINLILFMNLMETFYANKMNQYKYLQIFCATLMLFSWTYILFKSIHTLQSDAFNFIIPPYENPFN